MISDLAKQLNVDVTFEFMSIQSYEGTKSTGHNTTNGGFAGTDFNSGNGYANTIYAHANFLAGKKIKLLEKIMKAIEDVDEIYKQIEGKRAEYYEYNASGG